MGAGSTVRAKAKAKKGPWVCSYCLELEGLDKTDKFVTYEAADRHAKATHAKDDSKTAVVIHENDAVAYLEAYFAALAP